MNPSIYPSIHGSIHRQIPTVGRHEVMSCRHRVSGNKGRTAPALCQQQPRIQIPAIATSIAAEKNWDERENDNKILPTNAQRRQPGNERKKRKRSGRIAVQRRTSHKTGIDSAMEGAQIRVGVLLPLVEPLVTILCNRGVPTHRPIERQDGVQMHEVREDANSFNN